MAKKAKPVSQIIITPLLLLLSAAAVIYFIVQYFNTPRFVHYKEFGIDMPESYSIHGMDVSHHNGVIDWPDASAMKVKDIKMGFVFIKATEGISLIDDRFMQNWVNAKKYNLPRGAYHFFNASVSGKAQAETFIERVQLQKGDLPPVLDIEETDGASGDVLRQRAKDWLLAVEKHYKVKPIIYANVDFYERFLGDEFNNYPLWVAHYMVKNKPRIKRNWLFWQHNEDGRINGIDAPVDFNVFNGDSAGLKQLLIK